VQGRAIGGRGVSPRLLAAFAIALVAGILIGYVDSRPGWDDTAITAFSLLLASGIAAAIADRAPWLFAIATGIWVPLFELPDLAGGGSLAAFAFAAVGAAIGWFVGRR
jgi:hypothetical protein